MNKRSILNASMLLLATQFCYAQGLTSAQANNIIMILVAIILILILMGGYSLYYNKIIRQRNEQLRRILTALDEYRATVSDDAASPGKQKAASILNKMGYATLFLEN